MRASRTGLILTLLCLAGCAVELPEGLTPVEHPELAAIEDTARRQLKSQRAALDKALAKGDPLQMASSFGAMGELYHAYELHDAADACYRNAEFLDPESFLWPYYLGVLRQSAGDLEGAAGRLERALELRPDDGAVRRRLGQVRLAQGDIKAARVQFQKLLDSGNEAYAAAAHFGLGQVAATKRKVRQAVRHFERTLALQPEAGIVHHSLGLALRRLGARKRAREQLAKKGSGEVLSPDPQIEHLESLAISSGAYLARGNRALMAGRLDDAEAEFKGAIDANSANTGARRNLALALARKGDFDGAIEHLRAAADVDPDDLWIQLDLGNAYMGKGLAKVAVDPLTRAVEIDPELAQARFNLANALIALERWDDARPHLEAVARLEPGDRRARYQLAMANHHAGDHAAASRDLSALLKDEPDFTAARMGLAASLVAENRNAAAIGIYRQGLTLDLPTAEQIEILGALARLHWQQGKRQPAINYWRRVTNIDPESIDAWITLANGLQLIGTPGDSRQKEAQRLFARVTEMDPTNATAWLSETRLLILAHEFETARQRLGAALARLPDDAALNDTLARLLATCPDPKIRDGARARTLAQRAYALDQQIPYAETFGMALAEMGLYEEAIRWQRSVINEALRIGDQAALPRLNAGLKRYESRQPVRMAVAGR